MRVAQALETSQTRSCKENVQSFYDNLNELCILQNVSGTVTSPGLKWGETVDCEKRRLSRAFHHPRSERVALGFVCINAAGLAIPLFYIFRGKRFRQNYIQRCEPEATVFMQPRAWMTSYLFNTWISYFVESVR